MTVKGIQRLMWMLYRLPVKLTSACAVTKATSRKVFIVEYSTPDPPTSNVFGGIFFSETPHKPFDIKRLKEIHNVVNVLYCSKILTQNLSLITAEPLSLSPTRTHI